MTCEPELESKADVFDLAEKVLIEPAHRRNRIPPIERHSRTRRKDLPLFRDPIIDYAAVPILPWYPIGVRCTPPHPNIGTGTHALEQLLTRASALLPITAMFAHGGAPSEFAPPSYY